MIAVAEELSMHVGVVQACKALSVTRSALYRRRHPAAPSTRANKHHRALSDAERQEVISTLNSTPFADKSPWTVYAKLLDANIQLCSVRTMYRVLAAAKQVRERRNQLRRPRYAAPELLATAPNQLWCWDITKLHGPSKWHYYYLYVMLDVFSRYVVGWLAAEREHNELSQALITASYTKQGIKPGQLTIHADRGSVMKAKNVTELMADLGVVKTHSRPHVSNDNPFIEAHFKTTKYHPSFPGNFGSLQDVRAFCGPYFDWYNDEHMHSGVGYMTPAAVHYGEAPRILEGRQEVLSLAYAKHPERFVHGAPRPPQLPEAVWINPPKLAVLPVPGGPPAAVGPSPPLLLPWSAQDGSRVAEPPQRTLDASEHSGIVTLRGEGRGKSGQSVQ
jgi:putative transposase